MCIQNENLVYAFFKHVHDDVFVHTLDKLESKTSQNYAKRSDNACPELSNFLRTVAVFGSPNYQDPLISKV